MKLVECVPNFSEGRRQDVVDKIVAAGKDVPGITLLGAEMDADHNRSVVTFVGPPDAAIEAAFRMTAEAAKLIDLTQHQGEHPRMGATDVIPFIPLQDCTMEDCAGYAKRLGARIGKELGIPVFFYAQAATRPDRKRLPDIRQGEFEGLRDRIGTDPARAPDEGPARIHATAGATAVGARFFLIAYNVNLATADPALSQNIARAIRESGFKGTPGMFKELQASGFELKARGLTQVSMNLLDYRVTSPETVFGEIARRAAEAGVEIVESELVGLIPRDAVVAATLERLKLKGFRPGQIIENNLDQARSDVFRCFEPFLDALQSGAPTPGGGSASALAGALGAALGTMVTNLTIGKKKFAAVEQELTEVRARLLQGMEGLRAGVRHDAVLYDSVMAAYKLPKATPAEEAARAQTLEKALVVAAQGPLEVMELAVSLLPDLMTVAKKGNPNAASDAAVGALLLQACVHGAAMNVLINAKALTNQDAAARFRTRTAEIRESVDRQAPAVVAEVERGLQ
jgi:glutamate formiminotransferase / formiminotetrahydrofolate cyclodeaminase